MTARAVFWIINSLTLAAVGLGAGLHPEVAMRAPYVLVLTLICTVPLLYSKALNDRNMLLLIFSAIYYQFFGLSSLATLILGPAEPTSIQEVLTETDAVILIGIVMAHLAYRLVVAHSKPAPSLDFRDWPESMLAWVGLFMWIVCTYLSWQFQIHVVTDVTNEAVAQGLAKISRFQTMLYILAAYLQPFGILIIAYAETRYKRFYLLLMLILVVFGQVAYGFVIDVKGVALIGIVLAILTKMGMSGRIPKAWIAAATLFVVIAFPVMQANRVVRGEYGTNRTEAAANILSVLEHAIQTRGEATTGFGRSQTFFERTSLYGSVDVIVTRTGHDVPFQAGATMQPLLLTFIPRIILPNRNDVPTGQLMNKVFLHLDQEYTYISPSHLGELYWNFGWFGVIGGMFLIGAMLGLIGSKFDLSRGVTVTRLLVVLVTIKFVILGFESSIAVVYAVWLRCLPIIGLMHWIFARNLVQSPSIAPGAAPTVASHQRSFPHLMR